MTAKAFWLVPALALAAGVQALSFGPIHHELLQILSFTAALLLLGQEQRSSGLKFFAFQLLTLIVGLSWLHISMTRYGGMHAALSASALVAFCVYLALFGSAAYALYRLAMQRGWVQGALGGGLCLGGLWGLSELLRAALFTGFPWLSVGYAHVDGILSPWAALVGVYGVSAWAVCASCWLAGLFTAREADRRSLLLALVVLVLLSKLIEKPWTQTIGTAMRSLLIQTNIPQDQKFDIERLVAQQNKLTSMIGRAQVDLIVTPETAWITPWAHSPAESRERLLESLQRQGGVLALGLPLGAAIENGNTLPIRSNSMLLIKADGQLLGRYDKQHLVPFGEFVPSGFRWFVDRMRIPLGDFERGSYPAPVHPVAGRLIGFNICYEDLFPEEIALQVQQGAHVLVNASNLGWFGDSHALHQHLQISRMRSLELQRPMLRATNTGATAAIAADGSLIARLPTMREEVLVSSVQPMQGLTPFARFRLVGTGLLLVLMLVLALSTAWFRPASGGRIKIAP
ncbi:MAG: apolipoprotein N-acyltransferase [Betaproteobacteria bacterium]|nr:apolipoprotein N-acyltransferase [Betaproteobacteria bacterium]NCV33301.1 apolipoprotein N-acyltransferase [Betaproteobacteria bacterium]NCW33294.1 apolipoprotein N-acyltransferase [Betaproteobacteria bacterium]NCW50071.1 apolipoprotein N-acyltransferase [Betaproteobacteria bacterium]NCX11665.1 apolipoprotein N-acyltransferase [Betaproteobacteria bacterium]